MSVFSRFPVGPQGQRMHIQQGLVPPCNQPAGPRPVSAFWPVVVEARDVDQIMQKCLWRGVCSHLNPRIESLIFQFLPIMVQCLVELAYSGSCSPFADTVSAIDGGCPPARLKPGAQWKLAHQWPAPASLRSNVTHCRHMQTVCWHKPMALEADPEP